MNGDKSVYIVQPALCIHELLRYFICDFISTIIMYRAIYRRLLIFHRANRIHNDNNVYRVQPTGLH